MAPQVLALRKVDHAHSAFPQGPQQAIWAEAKVLECGAGLLE